MQFSNLCPVTREPIEKENGLIIKVPPPAGKKEKTKYFFISNESMMMKLDSCPFTRRKGVYSAVRLKDLNLEQMASISKKGVDNEPQLLEDNSLLDIVTKDFKWENRSFDRTLNTTNDVLRPTNRTNDILGPTGWTVCVTLGAIYMTLLAQNIFEAGYIRNPDDISAHYSGAICLAVVGAVVGSVSGYLTRQFSSNRHGFFTSPLHLFSTGNNVQHNESENNLQANV